MKLIAWALVAVLCLVGTAGASAQEVIVPLGTPTPPPTPNPEMMSTAQAQLSTPVPSVKLDGLTMIYQDYNRCSAAALTIQLSYFNWGGSYADTIAALNPHPEDVSVRLEEMAEFARRQGLGAIERVGGTPELLKALISAGFPVLVEILYYDGEDIYRDWMSHNRVVTGYDDAAQTWYVFDSLLGNGADGTGRPVPYDVMEQRWRIFQNDYLVLYRLEDEATVRAILGNRWDEYISAAYALAQAQAEIDAGRFDQFTYINMGEALVRLQRYEEAAAAFDRARRVRLPFRVWWYMFGAFEAYLNAGRPDDVITLGLNVLATTPGVEEAYYYLGRAYEMKDDTFRARSHYQQALRRNWALTIASEALERLDATAAAGGSGG